MSVQRLTREYPNINGFPVPPRELELPPTDLNPDKQESYNNHHSCWTARRMGRLVMTQTWRDLAANQTVIPKDTHAIIHDRYEPVTELPALVDLMDELDEAYRTQASLRYGSAHHPTFGIITEQRYRAIQLEYNQLNS